MPTITYSVVLNISQNNGIDEIDTADGSYFPDLGTVAGRAAGIDLLARWIAAYEAAQAAVTGVALDVRAEGVSLTDGLTTVVTAHIEAVGQDYAGMFDQIFPVQPDA